MILVVVDFQEECGLVADHAGVVDHVGSVEGIVEPSEPSYLKGEEPPQERAGGVVSGVPSGVDQNAIKGKNTCGRQAIQRRTTTDMRQPCQGGYLP